MSVLEELLETAQRLPGEDQLQLLAFAQGLAVRHRRPLKPTSALLAQAGVLDPAHVDEMMDAIEEACEHVDETEW
jgi:hypothetical protein